MIILKEEVLENYLKTIKRNRSWLALRLGYHRSYISLVMNNRCKISRQFIGSILRLTNFKFEDLFEIHNQEDDREFYGEDIYFGGRIENGKTYYEMLDRIRQKHAETNFEKCA